MRPGEIALDKPPAPDRYFWGRHKWLRWLYHPLIYITSKEYRTWRFLQKPQEERQQKLRKYLERQGQKLEIPVVHRADLIGRDEEYNTLWFSFKYHVLRDPDARKVTKPPSKVFLLKGDTGTGKTYLIWALLNEAYDEALKHGILLRTEIIRASQVIDMWLGQSARAMSSKLDIAFQGPSILVIDEAQQFVLRGSFSPSDSARQEDIRVETEILQRLDRIINDDRVRSLIIFSTDKFEHILETIRRRAEIIDLDLGINYEYLLELTRRLCNKYKVELNPEDILKVLGEQLRSMGRHRLTYSDITKAFDFVISEKDRPIIIGKAKEREPITLDDFKHVAKKVISYTEQEISQTAKGAKLGFRPPERYSDVGGLWNIKEQVIKEIMLCLRPELAKKAGYQPPKGFLFWGPPGTGKTLLAKAIAGETNAAFFEISAPALYTKWVGESEKNLRDIFAMAKKEAPSIIFMDEIDAIGRARGTTAGDAGVSWNLANTLLTLLDGFEPLGQVVFIGATNKPETLDPALLERLTRRFEFPYPRYEKEKLEVIDIHLRRIKSVLAPDITAKRVLRTLLKQTVSPRVIKDMIDLAARMRTMEIVAAQELLEAIQKDDPEEIQRLKRFYNAELQRIHKVHKSNEIKEEELLKIVAEGDKEPLKWPVSLTHFDLALKELLSDERYEEVLAMQRIYRKKEPQIGAVWGLAIIGQGGIAARGVMALITATLVRRRGEITVLGSAGVAMQDSATAAYSYICHLLPKLQNYGVSVHIISPGEGSDTPAITGPSAGQAIALAIITEALKELYNINLPISQDFAVTGKIEQKWGMAGWVGGVHPKDSAAKIDVAVREGFKVISIPFDQLEIIKKDYPEYITLVEDEGAKLVGAKDLIDNLAFATNKDRKDIETLLKTLNGKTKNYTRHETRE